ncbi:nuclear polyadenylated RNA-binding protein 3-like [Quillaja saponaria]|uniref:Nuclear polyadenylated RNA-binding protein 3-like n=1 Tax=Quillaja saponaria TaxID=32244 RepID=A0AAD7LZM5_QUISA|nr:nuclear polyadenylated RNA-binding protein 3-like [Quillaja saponaria]KAJ7967267.1 nuclear polyadenylated RNA-binding protein 3-like [Quillaja saponaria]
MGKQSGSTSSSMEFLVPEEADFIVVENDALSNWVVVNVVDGEGGEVEVDDDGDSVQNVFGSWDSLISWPISPKNNQIEGLYHDLVYRDVDVKVNHDQQFDDVGGGNGGFQFDAVGVENGGIQFNDLDDQSVGLQDVDGDTDVYGDRQFDDDEYDDDNGYDLDDELVPWSVSTKLGRQRMRKLGKRACPKMNSSKRSPYLFVRPGCVRGKHGLGLKHKI